MSEIKVNKISPRAACGTTTLGDNGDVFSVPCGSKINVASGGNITIASGATITNSGTASGFGATGAVNWDTTVKTTSFAAVAGNGYFCNTTGGTFNVTLPAGPSAGDIIGVADYANTFATAGKNLVLLRNGNLIGGQGTDSTLSTSGVAISFVYVDGVQGWLVTDAGNRSDMPTAEYISASASGCVTCSTDGNFKIHTFTGPGTFTVASLGNAAGGSDQVSYVIAAGGAGGSRSGGGGGGAGGFREGKYPGDPYTASPIATTGSTVTATAYPITVGGGGAGISPSPGVPTVGSSGSDSVFNSITSSGGGGGNLNEPPFPAAGAAGGSGGGGGTASPAPYWPNPGGAGNTPPVSPAQGFPGGGGSASDQPGGGGGGGATAVGIGGTNTPTGIPAPPAGSCGTGGGGGAGATTHIPGSPTSYSGGGGAGSGVSPQPAPQGGVGGGGTGGMGPNTASTAGGVNTGGGGGAGGGPSCNTAGGNGGSGVVIIRYQYQ